MRHPLNLVFVVHTPHLDTQALRGGAKSVFEAGWAAPEAAWASGLSAEEAATWGAVLAIRDGVNVVLEKVGVHLHLVLKPASCLLKAFVEGCS